MLAYVANLRKRDNRFDREIIFGNTTIVVGVRNGCRIGRIEKEGDSFKDRRLANIAAAHNDIHPHGRPPCKVFQTAKTLDNQMMNNRRAYVPTIWFLVCNVISELICF